MTRMLRQPDGAGRMVARAAGADTVRAHGLATAAASDGAALQHLQGSRRSGHGDRPTQKAPILFRAGSEFLKLQDNARSALFDALLMRNYGPNDFIYLQDDDAEQFYFIRSGYVRLSYLLEEGSAILYGILPSGESFGELGVFENGTHCDTATAVGNVSVASIPGQVFRSLGARYPEIDAAVGRVIARRYRSYVELTRMLSLKTLAARLALALLRLADGLDARMPVEGREVAFIGPMVTQADLGLMARGARGNVNRALKAWERAGWIAIVDRSIAILDRAKLEGLAFEDGL